MIPICCRALEPRSENVESLLIGVSSRRRDQGIVRRIADAGRCGTLAWKDDGRPGRTAIGNEQHLVVTTLSRAIGSIAVRADDPHHRGGSRGTGRSCRSGLAASCTREARRPRIPVRAFGSFPASRKAHDSAPRAAGGRDSALSTQQFSHGLQGSPPTVGRRRRFHATLKQSIPNDTRMLGSPRGAAPA